MPVLGPLLGIIGMIVGAILSMVGLYSAGPAHPRFTTAFTLTIVGLIIAIVSSFAGNGVMNTLLSIASDAVSFAVTYYVCTAASDLLASKGDEYQADRGQTIWKLYLGCMAVAIVCSILSIIPIIGVVAAVVLLLSGIVSLVAGILYLVFLHKASQSLLS